MLSTLMIFFDKYDDNLFQQQQPLQSNSSIHKFHSTWNSEIQQKTFTFPETLLLFQDLNIGTRDSLSSYKNYLTKTKMFKKIHCAFYKSVIMLLLQGYEYLEKVERNNQVTIWTFCKCS